MRFETGVTIRRRSKSGGKFSKQFYRLEKRAFVLVEDGFTVKVM